MSKVHWRFATAATLLICLQAGCQGPGRFSRNDFAQMEVDPFLAAEPDSADFSDDMSAANVADTAEAEGDRFRFVTDPVEHRDTESVSGDPKPSSPPASARSAVAAATTPDFGRTLADSQPVQTAEDAADGFDEFLRQNQDKVVQANAVFPNDQHGSSLARGSLKQVNHAVFPAAHQQVEIQDPVDDPAQQEKNPFAAADALASGGTQLSGQRTSWRPDNFQDVIDAE